MSISVDLVLLELILMDLHSTVVFELFEDRLSSLRKRLSSRLDEVAVQVNGLRRLVFTRFQSKQRVHLIHPKESRL